MPRKFVCPFTEEPCARTSCKIGMCMDERDENARCQAAEYTRRQPGAFDREMRQRRREPQEDQPFPTLWVAAILLVLWALSSYGT